MKRKQKWLFVLAILTTVLLSAPHATAIRVAVDSADPYYWLIVKLTLVAVFCLPWVVRHFKTIFSEKIIKYTVGSMICSAVALIAATLSVHASQASYVSIMSLSFPVIFVIISAWMLKERLSHRTIAGVTLAMIGAAVVVLVPIALSNQGVAFYPLSTALSLLVGVSSAIGTILMKQVHEKKVSLIATLGVNVLFAAIVSGFMFLWFGDFTRVPVDLNFWLLAIYSAFAVTLFGRLVTVWVFSRMGSATTSLFMYGQTFLSIIIPVVLIGEQLSLPMIIGGTCMLIAIYIIESHKTHRFHKATPHHNHND